MERAICFQRSYVSREVKSSPSVTSARRSLAAFPNAERLNASTRMNANKKNRTPLGGCIGIRGRVEAGSSSGLGCSGGGIERFPDAFRLKRTCITDCFLSKTIKGEYQRESCSKRQFIKRNVEKTLYQ